MLKKIVFGLLTALLALSLVGCGGGDDKKGSDDSAKKAAVPEYSADKAVLAYAELSALGLSENSVATGLSEKDLKTIEDNWDEMMFDSFKKFPLSDESAKEMSIKFYGRMASDMEISATLKKDDPEHPVVELKAKPIDQKAAAKFATESEDIQAIGYALNELQAQGITEDDLRANEEFQSKLVEVLESYVNQIPLKDEMTLEVTCEMLKGEDGKMYWAPVDTMEVTKFVMGQL